MGMREQNAKVLKMSCDSTWSPVAQKTRSTPGEERRPCTPVQQAVKLIHSCRRNGDLLMDVAEDIDWDELRKESSDRTEW